MRKQVHSTPRIAWTERSKKSGALSPVHRLSPGHRFGSVELNSPRGAPRQSRNSPVRRAGTARRTEAQREIMASPARSGASIRHSRAEFVSSLRFSEEEIAILARSPRGSPRSRSPARARSPVGKMESPRRADGRAVSPQKAAQHEELRNMLHLGRAEFAASLLNPPTQGHPPAIDPGLTEKAIGSARADAGRSPVRKTESPRRADGGTDSPRKYGEAQGRVEFATRRICRIAAQSADGTRRRQACAC